MPLKDPEKRREYQKQYNSNRIVNKEKRNEYEKKLYLKNRNAISKRRKKYREEHKEELRHKRIQNGYIQKERDWKLKRKYSISIDQYNSMVKSQDGVCAICSKTPIKKLLTIDHDHKTGKIRGLLCNSCNSGLGYFYDNTGLLNRAICYLLDS